ncbi:MAG: glycosyltransferase [Rhodoplanes sp.]
MTDFAVQDDERAEADVRGLRVAVLVPCYNEEATIAQVISSFHATLSGAAIYVYDNNSTDRTVEIARAKGAIVRRVLQQGKGHVVRRMFRDIEADIYLLVDGDATYHAPSAREMITRLTREQLDMVVAARIENAPAAFRRGHRFGNRMLTGFVRWMFGATFTDILSGYRAFSRRFVKSFPVLSGGFEIETELTVHALELELPVAEIAAPYFARPEGSASKLNTWRDGLRILAMIARLYRSERPLRFFSALGLFLAAVSIALSVPILITFLERGVVPRLPTAILSTGLMILACVALACGLILDTVTRGRREMKLLAYLAQAAPSRPTEEARPGKGAR